ncbi:MAG: signal transduction histidine kinase [Arenicella sp.]|jgi:signal transduction histidine kinase
MPHLTLFHKVSRLCLFAFVFFSFGYLQANPQSETFSFYEVSSAIEIPLSKLEVIIDSANKLSAFEILQFSEKGKFSKLDKSIRPAGNTTYWLRVTISNQTDRDRDWLAYPGKFFVKELYDWDSLQLGIDSHKSNGRLIAYNEKNFKGFSNFDQPIELFTPKNETKTYLFKLYSPTDFYLKRSPWLILYEPTNYRIERYFSNVVGAFVVGGLSLIAIYHLLLFAFVREKMYLSFIGLLISSALFFAYYHGFTIEFLWRDYPLFDSYSFLFILAGLGIFWLRFSKYFLATGKEKKAGIVMVTILQVLHLIPPACAIYDLTAPAPALHLLTQTANFQIALVLFTQLFIFAVAVVGVFRKTEEATSFLLANSAALLGGVLLAFQFFRIIPHQEWIVYAPEIGFLFMSVIFSYGVGKKIVLMRSEIVEKQLRTERLEREKEQEKQKIIEQKNIELEQKVMERTSQVVHQKEEISTQRDAIEEQNEELKLLNEEKNNLINIVAHDLKSPLNQINGIMYVFKATMPDMNEDQGSLVDMVSDATTRLSQMITNLLDINAIESGQLNINLKKTDITTVAKRLQPQFVDRANKKNIQIHEDFSQELYISIDESYLGQVFENLVSNAIKFSPQHRNIYLSVKQAENEIVFSVRDEGPGLKEKDMEKMFGKFQKLSAQPTDGEHSTGLGLSIVKRFMEAMNGKVWAESNPKVGATFFVSLPIYDKEQDLGTEIK